MEKFIIRKKNGHGISCIREYPNDPKGIVIAVHGLCSSRECSTFAMLARRLPAAGYAMIGIELPGHGAAESSREPLRIEGAIDSIETAEEYAGEVFPGLPVFYFGSSFGAYLTCLYISARPHRGRAAFLRSAAVNMPSLFIKEDLTEEEKKNMEELRTQGWFETSVEGLNPVRITREFYDDLSRNDLFSLFDSERFGPHRIAMAHGSKDSTIEPDEAKRFAKQFRIPITVFAGEGHSLSINPRTPERVADLAIALYRAGEDR